VRREYQVIVSVDTNDKGFVCCRAQIKNEIEEAINEPKTHQGKA
jgi:hypothetical protein